MTERRNLNATRHHEVGSTPFMLAALVADAELMRTLVELGADPLAKNDEFSTPLMAAAGLGTRSPGEDAGTEEEVIEVVEMLLELGDDINAVDDNGETAMHGAAYKNLPGVVELLAANGANIDVWNEENRYGWTPLTIRPWVPVRQLKRPPVTVDRRFERVMTSGSGVERGGGGGRRHLRVRRPRRRSSSGYACRRAEVQVICAVRAKPVWDP